MYTKLLTSAAEDPSGNILAGILIVLIIVIVVAALEKWG